MRFLSSRRYFQILMFILSLGVTRQQVRAELEQNKGLNDPEVVIMTVQKEELFDYIRFSGMLSPKSSTTVYAPLAGQILKVNTDEGDKVKKGDKLVIIRPDSDGLVYKDHILKAPSDGVVLGGMSAKSGTRADRNQELLTLADLSSFKTSVAATLDDLPHLKKDQDVEIIIGDKHEHTLKAKIANISGAPDPKTKTFSIPIRIPCDHGNSCEHVFPGLLVKILVKKNIHMGFKVPYNSLQNDKSEVFVLNEDSTVRIVKVRMGEHFGSSVEVLDGLVPGMKIITSYSKMPKGGTKVKVIDPTVPKKL